MARVHLSRVIRRPKVTITTTLCGRSARGDDINCTEDELDVTCKLCVQAIEIRERDFPVVAGIKGGVHV